MATLKYNLIGSKDIKAIWLFYSNGGKNQHKKTTGFKIDSKDWSSKTGLPKQTTPNNKNLSTLLQKLLIYVSNEIKNKDINGEPTTKTDLKNWINSFLGKGEKIETSKNTFDYWIDYIVNNASTRPNSKGGIGIGKARIQKYKRLKKIIQEWKGKEYKIKDFDRQALDELQKYLIEVNQYADNYTAKVITDIKSVLNEAKLNGKQIDPQVEKYKPPRVKTYDADMDVVYFTEQEIKKLENAHFDNNILENARKWLLIGVYSGQRYKDFHHVINPSNRIVIDGEECIKIPQNKGNKRVHAPIFKELEPLLDNPPTLISNPQLNKHIKEVCRLLEMDTPTLRKLDQAKNKLGRRKEKQLLPKYRFVGSHIGRRTFATRHFGKLPNAVIMSVTGHVKESTFLSYVNAKQETAQNLRAFKDLKL